jgi:hypothetical protein
MSGPARRSVHWGRPMYSGGAVLMAALHYGGGYCVGAALWRRRTMAAVIAAPNYGAGYYVDALAMTAPNYRAAALRRPHLLAASHYDGSAL